MTTNPNNIDQQLVQLIEVTRQQGENITRLAQQQRESFDQLSREQRERFFAGDDSSARTASNNRATGREY